MYRRSSNKKMVSKKDRFREMVDVKIRDVI